MIVWATEFPLAKGTSPDDVLEATRQWLTGSPYLPWSGFAFGSNPIDDIVRYERAGQLLAIARISQDGGTWCGVQHVWVEKGEREWTTEIVAWEVEDSLTVGIRLDCNLLAPGMRLPRPHKPHFVRQFLERFGGGADSWLPVADEPTLLGEGQVEDAAAIIHGTTMVRLPIVYASAGRNHKPYINVVEISRWLSGMAHIVVEPSRHFAFALARHVNRGNPYGGAASVFWPRAVEPQVRFIPSDFPNPHEMTVAIANRVRSALTTVRPTPQLTWPYIRELVSRRRVETLRRAGEAGVQEYIDAFDAENAAREALHREDEREIGRLQAEIRRLEARNDTSGGLLNPGKEMSYYPGEHKDAILHALTLGLQGLDPTGRRRHIIQDIIAHNRASGNEDEITEDVKRLFSSGVEVNAETQKALEDLGFEVIQEGKHLKAIFQDDGRYTFVISKTSSDHRAGRNLVSQINRTLFK